MVRADACWRINERIDHGDAIKKNLSPGGGTGQVPAPLRRNDEADGCRSDAEGTARSSANSTWPSNSRHRLRNWQFTHSIKTVLSGDRCRWTRPRPEGARSSESQGGARSGLDPVRPRVWG